MLQQRLIAGLPYYLKVPISTSSTDFETAVTQLGQVAEEMNNSASRRRYETGELVNEMCVVMPVRRRTGGQPQVGTGWIRDRSKPRGSRENPVGFDPVGRRRSHREIGPFDAFDATISDASESARRKSASGRKWHAMWIRETDGGWGDPAAASS